MASPDVRPYSTNDLKNKFLHAATTSKYIVYFSPPTAVVNHLKIHKNIVWNDISEMVNISCVSAKLPGSSLATHDVTSDFLGVTEKMAYRRMYDDTFSVTVLVDSHYKVLHFFEGWLDYIVGKNDSNTGPSDNKSYETNYRIGTRMNYPNGPNGYRSNVIELIKFNSDMGARNVGQGNQVIKYNFVEGFPTSMDPIELSYGSTDLLQLNVNFKFIRYNTEPYLQSTILPPED